MQAPCNNVYWLCVYIRVILSEIRPFDILKLAFRIIAILWDSTLIHRHNDMIHCELHVHVICRFILFCRSVIRALCDQRSQSCLATSTGVKTKRDRHFHMRCVYSLHSLRNCTGLVFTPMRHATIQTSGCDVAPTDRISPFGISGAQSMMGTSQKTSSTMCTCAVVTPKGLIHLLF